MKWTFTKTVIRNWPAFASITGGAFLGLVSITLWRRRNDDDPNS